MLLSFQLPSPLSLIYVYLNTSKSPPNNMSNCTRNTSVKCKTCKCTIRRNQKSSQCSLCCAWFHNKCENVSSQEFSSAINIIDSNWSCKTCKTLANAEIFPFGSLDNYDLSNTFNYNSSQLLDNLPSFDTTSKATKINSLADNDIDSNVSTNINSKYYSVHEFQSLEIGDNLNILHSNVNGYENKFDNYHTFLNSCPFNIDLLCISETSQRENVNFKINVTLEGYQTPFCLGSRSARGGVLIYAKNDLKVLERQDLNMINDDFEAIWIEIINENGKNSICSCIYRHPKSNIDNLSNYLTNCINKINGEKKICHIAGDFNIDYLKYDSSKPHCDFINSMASLGFLPFILQPTRITEYSSTIIDNIYSNVIENETLSGNILIEFADHLSQFLSIKMKVTKTKMPPMYAYDYSNFDAESFKDDVSIQNWFTVCERDTNSKFNDFLWRLKSSVERHVPYKKLSRKQQQKATKPWITNEILKLIKLKDKLYHTNKLKPNSLNLRAYKLFRNRITREIKKSKKKYYNEYFSRNLANMKKTWDGIKNIVNYKDKSSQKINELSLKGNKITNSDDIASTFNDFFYKCRPKS